MISAILGLVIWVLRAVGFLLLVYCILTIIAPNNTLVRRAGTYVEPVLAPFRGLLHRIFPKLSGIPVDFSPLIAWLVIDIAIWVLVLIRGLFS